MKPILLFCMLILPLFATAQTPAASGAFPRTITVTGSAETAVIPDEIYVSVTLREYTRKGAAKKELHALSTDFLTACKDAGIPDSAIAITGLSGDNERWYWNRKIRTLPDLQGEITYEIKVNRFDKVEALAEKLDDYGTGFHVSRVSHSNAAAFRKQLKIDAIKAAKEKARYLAEAIGENIGLAVTITEPEENTLGASLSSQVMSNSFSPAGGAEGGANQSVLSRKVKFRYEVSVVFALK